MRCLFVYLCLRNIYQKWKKKSFLHAQNQLLRVVLISMELWCALTKFYQNPTVEFNPSPKLLEGLTQFIFINICFFFDFQIVMVYNTCTFLFFHRSFIGPQKGRSYKLMLSVLPSRRSGFSKKNCLYMDKKGPKWFQNGLFWVFVKLCHYFLLKWIHFPQITLWNIK